MAGGATLRTRVDRRRVRTGRWPDRATAARRLRADQREVNMPTEAKREAVAQLKDELSAASTMIVSEYRGLKVTEIAEIRRSLRKQNVSYRVVKNRLMRIAATESGNDALPPMLTGPTAIAFGNGDEAAIAKAVLDATKPYKIVTIKGGVLGTRAIDADGVTRLATLPPRDVLLAQIAGAIAAPMASLAGLFDAPLRDLAGGIGALADQRAARA
jgi:large subunit ribosomal protein L10